MGEDLMEGLDDNIGAEKREMGFSDDPKQGVDLAGEDRKKKGFKKWLKKNPGLFLGVIAIGAITTLALMATFGITGGDEVVNEQFTFDIVTMSNSTTPIKDDDGDGLADILENKFGTDELQEDTDLDGMPDGWEVDFGVENPITHLPSIDPTDPNDAYLDPDNDGLSNLEEFLYSPEDGRALDPNTNDTDEDGLPDGWEVIMGLDPLESGCYDRPQRCDGGKDTDLDLLNNTEEYRMVEIYGQSTDINKEDTDGDGLTDYEEVYVTLTNPVKFDSDGDGMPDGWEYYNNLDENVPVDPADPADATDDLDGDGLTNLQEYRAGTEISLADRNRDGTPDGWDSDGDGMPDEFEVVNARWSDILGRYTLDPKKDTGAGDANLDPDNDGLTNLEEYLNVHQYQRSTDPNSYDTDGDGLSDYEESRTYAALGPNPFKKDTDGDRLLDGEEVKIHGTNASSPDSDIDGLTDYEEVNAIYLKTGQRLKFQTDPLDEDPDDDGLRDFDEVLEYGTNPWMADTDEDGINDGDEVMADFNLDLEGKQGTNPLEKDTDGDGMDDGWEFKHSDPDQDGIPTWWEKKYGFAWNDAIDKNLDRDDDGATNYVEYLNNTDPFNPNTDGDTKLDGAEVYGRVIRPPLSVNARINPLDPSDKTQDPDGDGLTNYEEFTLDKELDGDLDPNNPDTDFDQLPDGWEIQYNVFLQKDEFSQGTRVLQPVNADSIQGPKQYVKDDTFEDIDRDGQEDVVFYDPATDTYGDGLTNLEEFFYGTSPISSDTDGDGIPDGWEVYQDNDGDGLFGIWERKYGFDPFHAGEEHEDTDGDGVDNTEEFRCFTDPRDSKFYPIDDDGDGMCDLWEQNYGLDEKNGADKISDLDSDGVSNYDEYLLGTKPNRQDTDGDGFTDGQEVDGGSNPLNVSDRP